MLDDDKNDHSSADLTRMAYFKLNPYWTTQSERSIRHVISYAHRYAEKGDYEVAVID